MNIGLTDRFKLFLYMGSIAGAPNPGQHNKAGSGISDSIGQKISMDARDASREKH
jgi:hypothetical protein